MRFAIATLLLAAAALLAPLPAHAEVAPHTLTFTARLDSGGVPLDGAHDVTISLWTDSSGGSLIWTEAHDDVPIDDGLLVMQLGIFTTLVDVFNGFPFFLEVSVDGSVLSPRTQLTSEPYALRAASAFDSERLAGLPASNYLRTVGFGLTVGVQGVAVVPSLVQKRVLGSCPAGSAIGAIAEDGSVTCNSTAASEGFGIDVSGATVSVDTTQVQQRVTGTCASGFLAAIAGNGTVTCAAEVGDITSVQTPLGGGLMGGLTNGAPQLTLLNCGPSEILKNIGTEWSCHPDEDTAAVGMQTAANFNLTSVFATVVTKNATIPNAGAVMLTTTITLTNGAIPNAATSVLCETVVDGASTGTVTFDPVVAGNQPTTASASTVASVNPGAHVFLLRCRTSPATKVAAVTSGNLIVQFFPNSL